MHGRLSAEHYEHTATSTSASLNCMIKDINDNHQAQAVRRIGTTTTVKMYKKKYDHKKQHYMA